MHHIPIQASGHPAFPASPSELSFQAPASAADVAILAGGEYKHWSPRAQALPLRYRTFYIYIYIYIYTYTRSALLFGSGVTAHFRACAYLYTFIRKNRPTVPAPAGPPCWAWRRLCMIRRIDFSENVRMKGRMGTPLAHMLSRPANS